MVDPNPNPAPHDYQYDVFLSFRRRNPALEWVQNHFYPRLEEWLGENLPREPRIFVDWNIEVGMQWPQVLANALRSSRCLVAVWSPQYFLLPWCLAEWKSMLDREKILGLQTGGLVYAVGFADGDMFPPEAKNTQYRKLHQYSIPQPKYIDSVGYVDFVKEMQLVAGELAQRVESVPAWQPAFPIVLPDPGAIAAPGPIPMPRL